MPDDCIFCKIAAGDIPTDILDRDDLVFAIRDVNPQAPVHLLVMPIEHIASVAELGPHNADLISRMTLMANAAAAAEGIAQRGYRLTINCGEEGGQSVGHLHMHLLGGSPLGAVGVRRER